MLEPGGWSDVWEKLGLSFELVNVRVFLVEESTLK
jgi:hypothetical protein